ncbi:MAG: 8-oxo-dGTP diphosphatase MutT [Arenicellales bacterium]|nr:8-oxo-dGTP diphosphatase MutT [Arenicellales bacterium]MDP7521409.1 8-oxo-dGTP diphosphatase MutT [Arenicellales bacterium]
MPTTDPDSGRPLAPWFHVAVGVLVDDRQQVLIQERIPGTPYGGQWEFPGGKVNSDETAWEALVRELDEELGIEAKSGSPLFLTDHDYPDRHVRLDFWSVERWIGAPFGREGQQVSWVEPGRLRNYPFLKGNQLILDRVIQAVKV